MERKPGETPREVETDRAEGNGETRGERPVAHDERAHSSTERGSGQMDAQGRPRFAPRRDFEAFKEDRDTTTGPVYEPMLARCPVAHIASEDLDERAKVDYWAILGYDELVDAARDYRTFSSVTPTSGPRVLPLQSDPPEHAGIRRMLNPFFTAEAAERVEPQLLAFGGEMLDAMIARGEADFAQEFAYPFPTRSLCVYLGFSQENWEFHHGWVTEAEEDTGQGLFDPDTAVPPDFVGRVVPYIQEALQHARSSPRDDVISGIAQAEIAGEPVDDMAATFLVMTMMLAGHITTTSAIGAMVTRLARDRDLQDRLRAAPDRIDDLVEETLRVDGPQQAMPRRCVRDTEVAGHAIAAGERVMLNFGSGNVDPAHWPDAGEFDLDRADKRHLSFGRGLHLCIGRHLARAEMRLTARELLARTASFELGGPVRRSAWPLSTVKHMPLRFGPA